MPANCSVSVHRQYFQSFTRRVCRFPRSLSRHLSNHNNGAFPVRAANRPGSPAIVLAGVKGRLCLFALDAGLRATAALSLSGRGSHVPSSSDLRPYSGRGRTWEHGLVRNDRAGARPGQRAGLMRLGCGACVLRVHRRWRGALSDRPRCCDERTLASAVSTGRKSPPTTDVRGGSLHRVTTDRTAQDCRRRLLPGCPH